MLSVKAYNMEKVYSAVLSGKDEFDFLRQTPGGPNLIIGQISGRDSLAAVVRHLETDPAGHIMPVADKLPNLNDQWGKILNNVDWLKAKFGGRILDLTVFEHGAAYQELTALSRQYLDSPCVGCHLYFHVYPIPILLFLGGKRIISGARWNHDGIFKLNQVPLALKKYKEIVEAFGADLLFPIQDVEKVDEILEILNFSNSHLNKDSQLKCDPDFGKKPFLDSPDQMNNALHEFFIEARLRLEILIKPFIKSRP